MNPLVSIIVPVYRIKEEYLRACIESLTGQTYRNIEILLVDDGSPDDCGAICDSYAEKLPLIKVIHQENQGVSVARNHGIEAAAGEYIIFVDADDWIEPDCVEIAVGEIEKQKVDVLFFQRKFEGAAPRLSKTADSRFLEKDERKAIQLAILMENASYDSIDFKPPWGKIIKNSLLKKRNLRFPVGVKKSQDVLFNLYLYEFMESAYYLNYVGYHYRVNSESINHRYNPEMPRTMIRVLEEAEKFVIQYHSEDEDYKKALGIRAVKLVVTIEHTYTLHKESTLSLNEIRCVTSGYLRTGIVEKYVSQCRVSDFDMLKRKIRLLMYKQKSLLFYLCFCQLKRARNK